MHGKQQRAAESEQRAGVEAEAAARHAEEVQTDQRNRNAAPVLETAAAAEQQAKHRHDQNVTRGHKACLADRGVQERYLLRGARDAQHRAAARAAEQQGLSSLAPLLRRHRGPRRADPAQHRNHGQKHDAADDASRADVGQRTDIFHTDALRHERRAPDGGREQQKQRISQFHLSFSPLRYEYLQKKNRPFQSGSFWS